jgi:hypothetical protein
LRAKTVIHEDTMNTQSFDLPDPHYQPEFYADVPLKRLISWAIDTVLIVLLVVLILPFTAFTGLFFLPLLARVGDLIGRHRGITDEDTLVVCPVGAQDLPCGRLLIPAACVVFPDAFIKAVMEVEVLKVFELRFGGGEKLFDHFDVRIHRAANIEKQKDFHGVAPLWAGLDV